MSFFKGVEDARYGAGGVYFLANKGPTFNKGETVEEWVPALYVVEIKQLITMTSRKKDDLFIVEALIIKSDCPERKVGMSCSWVVNLKQDAALGNIKGFIAAANGIEPTDEEKVNAEVTEEACTLAVSKDQPLAGIKLGLECTMIKTKAQKLFTLHRWSPMDQAA